MKERILSDLAKLGAASDEGQLTSMRELTGLEPEEISSRARALRSAMLHRYGDLAVMTLDSFTNRLVKSFARDLALDQDYRIELDQDRIVEEAVGQLLDRIGADGEEELTEMLKGFARLQVEEEKDSRIRQPLLSYGREVLKEGMRGAMTALESLGPSDFAALSDAIRVEVKKEERELASRVKLALDAVRVEGLTKKDVKRGSLISWLEKNRRGEAVAPTPSLVAMFEEGVFTTKAADDAVVDAVERVRPLAEHAWVQVQAMVPGTAEGEAHVLRKRLLHKIDLVGTLALLSEEIEEVQQSRNVRTFQALHERVARVVRHNPVPFLYERLGSRFDHVFVDEFQDTSVIQWQNLIPLVDHGLAERNLAMVVGDGKQAIYRWRNGDYRQLLHLPDVFDDEEGAFADAARTFKEAQETPPMIWNWRSGTAIVDWNNRFFETLKTRIPERLKGVYANHTQTAKKPFEGQVHVEAVVEKDRQARESALNEAIEARIRHHASKEGGGFQLQDIAVLVRTNKQGAVVAQHLLSKGIVPQTEDSLHVGRHPAALAVVSLTRWVVDPKEDRHATMWLQCMAAMEPERIHESELLDKHVRWFKGDDDTTYSVFDAEGLMAEIYPELQPFKHAYGPLVSWIGHACEVLGVTGRFDVYAETLMELAREVTGADEGGLRGFLRTWERTGHSRSVIASGGTQAVQIMTVHKAKGLAFPVTIFVAGNNKLREVKGNIPVLLGPKAGVDLPAALLRVTEMKDTALDDVAESELDEAQLDQINIAYVAMTRPIERLDVLAETTTLDFDRADPSTLSQMVLACTEEMEAMAFGPDGMVCEAGEGKRRAMATEKEEAFEVISTQLQLGAQGAQRVSLAPKHVSQVHADELDDAAIGSLVHGLLSEVKSAEDWRPVRLRFESSWTLHARDRARVLALADEVFNHDESEAFFRDLDRVECEPDWMDEKGLLRPDRVVQKEGQWHVVDYKTGDVDLDDHQDQVRRYMHALSAMEHTDVTGWILYLNPWRLVKVDSNGTPRIFEAD